MPARRVPSHAPSAKPASASAPVRNPCAHPNRASSSTSPTMIQSTPVMPWTLPAARDRPDTARRRRLPRRPLGRTRDVKTKPGSAGAATPPSSGRRRSRASRLAPLVMLAVVAFIAGAVVGLRHEPAQAAVARHWGAAWERGDYAAMHGLLSARARRRTTLRRFERTYRQAAETMTATRVRTGEPRRRDGDVYEVPVTFRTRMFG